MPSGLILTKNYLIPGTILTSAVKRVDVAVANALNEAEQGKFASGVETLGVETLGLAENGVGWALDENNRSLVTAKMEEQVNELRQKIIDGKIKVHDYSVNNRCVIPNREAF